MLISRFGNIVVETMNVDRVLKVNEHVDGGWFWTKYSANPYLGCQYACSYCFLRENIYGLNKDTRFQEPFSQIIKVKVNAAEVLEKELANVPVDIINVGDYQPIDAKFKISRKMLEVCYKLGFPVILVCKSPLVLRDIDLIKKISEKSWACVVFSVASMSEEFRNTFEPYASSVESRYNAIQKLSDQGIYVGTALIPVMPFINDTDENLEGVVKKTKESGGKFVMAGGLVLGDGLTEHFYRTLTNFNPKLIEKYKKLYNNGFSPNDDSWRRVGLKVRELCSKYGLDNRIKRFVMEGPSTANKELAEQLFLRVYDLELYGADEKIVSSLRKLAWNVDESAIPMDRIQLLG